MSHFEIKTNVPMPGPRNRYPFETMEVGSSFEIVGETEARKVRNAAYQYAKKTNLNLAIQLAEQELGRELTSEEKAAVGSLPEGTPGEVRFALRKLSETGEGAHKVVVSGLWRTH